MQIKANFFLIFQHTLQGADTGGKNCTYVEHNVKNTSRFFPKTRTNPLGGYLFARNIALEMVNV